MYTHTHTHTHTHTSKLSIPIFFLTGKIIYNVHCCGFFIQKKKEKEKSKHKKINFTFDTMIES